MEKLNRVIAFMILEIFILTNGSLAYGVTKKDTPVTADSQTVNQTVSMNTTDPVKEEIDVKPVITDKAVEKVQYTDLKFDDITLKIPDGAIDDPAVITVTKLESVEELGKGMENVTGLATGYRFLPHGTQFKKPILIEMPFDKNLIRDEAELADLYTYFYNEDAKQWEKLPRVHIDLDRGILVSSTTHFTDMINSTLKLPDTAKPLSFNLNTIKDIKAADPLSGIPQIQGLSANQQGSAAFSLPLSLPAGRKGMMPSLALSYNSQGGNGLLGVGFDLQIPVISIDTRFGLPAYNGTDDTYLLNGEELVYTESLTGVAYYKSRIEGGFARIQRFGNNTGNYYFVVTDKSGTVYEYGKDRGKLVNYRNSAVNRWYLSKIIDTNGNNVKYYYTDFDHYLYPSQIRYTGYNDTDGDYTVRFDLEDRSDIQVDGRGKFVSKLSKRLKSVRIEYQGKVLRKYAASYIENDFKKSALKTFSEYSRKDTDPAGDATSFFYSYDFDYYSIKDGDKLDGYSQIKELADFNELKVDLNKSYGGGGSLYIGVGWMKYDYSIGGNVGYNGEYTNAENLLIDINGDGLLDFVEKTINNSRFQFRPNLGNYQFGNRTEGQGEADFETSLMNEQSQHGFELGVSGGAGSVLSGSFGGKWDWSSGFSSFSDINGDGFVDYIPSHFFQTVTDHYLQNDGKSFKRVNWGDSPDPVGISAISDPKAEEVKSSLYLTDPVIRFTPFRRGNVLVTSTAVKQGDSTAKEYDGVKIDLYKNNQTLLDQTSDGHLLKNDDRHFLQKEVSLPDSKDALYFKTNSIKDIDSDKIDWDIQIRYTSIYLYENLKDYYNPVTTAPSYYTYDDFTYNVIPKITSVTHKDIVLNGYTAVIETLYNNGYPYGYSTVGYKLKDGITEASKTAIFNILVQYGIIVMKTFTYGTETYPVKLNQGQYYIEMTDPLRNCNTIDIKANDQSVVLGTLTRDGLLYDLIKGESGDIIARKWMKDDGNAVTLFLEDQDGIRENLNEKEVTRQGNLLKIIEKDQGRVMTSVFTDSSTDTDLFKTIHEGFFIDLSADLNSNPDLTVDMSACYLYQDDGYYHLKTGYNADIYVQIKNKLKEYGISSYDSLKRDVRLNSDGLYPVYPEYLPASTVTEEVINDSPYEDMKPRGMSSFVYEPVIQSNGETLLAKKYIHVFDRKKDFTLNQIEKKNDFSIPYYLTKAEFDRNLSYLRDRHPKESADFITNKEYMEKAYLSGQDGNSYILDTVYAEKPITSDEKDKDYKIKDKLKSIFYNLGYAPDYFGGGTYNWSFGEWNGNKVWDISKFGIFNENEKSIYLTSMGQLAKDAVDGEGKPVNKLDQDVYLGSDFGYSERKPDANGNIQQIDHYSATYIALNELSPSRKGGESIRHVPSLSSNGTGGLDSPLRTGFNWGISVSGSIGPVTAGYIFNRSTSFRDFFDINGDRYPDKINYQIGNNSAHVVYNNRGINLASGATLSNLFEEFRSTSTNTVNAGVGFSLEMTGTWKKIFINSKGLLQYVKEGKASESTLPVLGINIGGNFSGSMTTIDWVDINGDGLIDQVKRDPVLNPDTKTYYKVKLNVGDGFVDMDWNTAEWKNNPVAPLSSQNVVRNSWLYGGNLSATAGVSKSTAGPGVSGNISASVSASIRSVYTDFVDMNGDGLPDQVLKMPGENFRVKFNLGDHFSDEIEWNTNQNWNESSMNGVVSGNVSNVISSMSRNLGMTPDSSLTGLNLGDSNKAINTAAGLPENSINMDAISDTMQYSVNLGISASLNFSIGIPFTFVSLFISPSAMFNYSESSSGLQINDVDGDGLPDHVLTVGGRMKARINNAGLSGLIKSINTPAGGSIDLGYERTPNSVEMPNSFYVLTSVTYDDGIKGELKASTDQGEHQYSIQYSYAGGKYDRSERSFYGFQRVRTTQSNGVYTETTYYMTPSIDNPDTNASDYYTKSLPVRSITCYENNRVIQEEESFYDLVLSGSHKKAVIWPRINHSLKTVYDEQGNSITTAMYFDSYDEFGNILQATDAGDTKDSLDDVTIKISYAHQSNFSLKEKYIVGIPQSLTAEDRYAHILRKKEGEFDSRGNLIRHHQILVEKGEYLSNEFTYDGYGNIQTVRDPSGYTVNYIYDNTLHTYLTEIHDNLGSTSTFTYDPLTWLEKESKDSNNSTMTKVYDEHYRLKKVFTSYDNFYGIPAVQFDYDLSSFPRSAVTRNKVSKDPYDTAVIRTVVYADGLGRALQTAKETEVRTDGVKKYGYTRSGAVETDSMGQVIRQGFPDFYEGELLSFSPVEMKYATINEYDPLGRVIRSTLADGSTVENTYEITSGGEFKTTVKDPNGNSQNQYADADGKTLRIEQFNEGKTLTTKYEYNILGEIIAVIDNKGFKTTITYDSLGRRTSIKNPDMGLIEYKFNNKGLLEEKVDPNLRSKIHGIRYEYQYSRLVKMNYPDKPDTVFEYGASGASYNRAGRLVKVTGESGSEEYFYGKLGEANKTIKTIKSLKPGTPDFVYATESTFNYLGQIDKMVYPDGEAVNYSYDRGGNIRKVTGNYRGYTTDYVKDIAYDEFGQRNFIRYGNDTETTYSYDPVRRWLKNIKTLTPSGSPASGGEGIIQNAEYTFDRVGNISKIVNSPTNRKITQVFSYDQLYQLKTSDATFEDTTYLSAKYKNTYSQTYSYDTIGNMTSKVSVQNDNRGVSMESLNYSLNYSYSSAKPHQATKIGDLAYIYDPNGNLISKGREGETSNTVKTYYGDLDGEGWVDAAITQTTKADEEVQIDPTGEKYFWNEDNQLVKSVVNGQEAFYSYDTSGQRVVKKSVFGETVYINQFMEVKDDDLATKFIYVGESRVISKLSHIHDLNGGEYERINTYYHHTDHLGTSNVITDYQGNIYKEIYLTPYGEEFVNRGDTLKKITADFTGKSYDSETKMHYFGARYYDSKTSRWVSPDPAYSEYLNSDKGMGGIYNPVNSQVYHYAGSNPLKYVDPDGNELKLWHYIHIASAVYSTVNFVAGLFGNKENNQKTKTTSTTTSTTTTTIPEPKFTSKLERGNYYAARHNQGETGALATKDLPAAGYTENDAKTASGTYCVSATIGIYLILQGYLKESDFVNYIKTSLDKDYIRKSDGYLKSWGYLTDNNITFTVSKSWDDYLALKDNTGDLIYVYNGHASISYMDGSDDYAIDIGYRVNRGVIQGNKPNYTLTKNNFLWFLTITPKENNQ